jgi:hypothetical protein
MQRGATGKGIFKATLSVIEGAFRFTTAAIYKFNGRREINVRFRTVTAGSVALICGESRLPIATSSA